MADLKHLGHMFSDVLKSDVFKLAITLRTFKGVYLQIHPFTIGTGAGQGPVGHQMGLDLIKIKFLINSDKSFRHVGHYNIIGELGLTIKKPAESSILF